MDEKRFLFVSADAALITDLAWQVHREGHDVKYYIEAESDREIGDGFVPKTDDWRAEVEWADVVVFDDIWVGSDVGTGALAQELREQGKAVVGGTPNTDQLEEDRGYAMEILEEHGVNTIEYHVFEDFDAGIQHVQENPAPYVSYPRLKSWACQWTPLLPSNRRRHRNRRSGSASLTVAHTDRVRLHSKTSAPSGVA
jgi:phosphoribosylamine--glycine ligase